MFTEMMAGGSGGEPQETHVEWFFTGTDSGYTPNYNYGSTDGTMTLVTCSASSATVKKKCTLVKSNNNLRGNNSTTVVDVGYVINQTSSIIMWCLIDNIE